MSTTGQTLLRQYLDQVQHTMHQAQHSPQEIEVVLDALEEQFEERTTDPLTAQQARQILAHMPPPASYTSTETTQHTSTSDQTTAPPTNNPLGILSVILCLGTILSCIVLGVVAEASQTPLEDSGGAILLMGLSAAMVAGFFARRTPTGKFGLYGSAIILGVCLLGSQI